MARLGPYSTGTSGGEEKPLQNKRENKDDVQARISKIVKDASSNIDLTRAAKKLNKLSFPVNLTKYRMRFDWILVMCKKDFQPRVLNAYFLACYNRICTSARFQTSARCILCDGKHTKDSVEHWPYCPVYKAIRGRIYGANLDILPGGVGPNVALALALHENV